MNRHNFLRFDYASLFNTKGSVLNRKNLLPQKQILYVTQGTLKEVKKLSSIRVSEKHGGVCIHIEVFLLPYFLGYKMGF